MKKHTILLTLTLFALLPLRAQNDFLIEAEAFPDKGGWVTDPQFVEQMGSPYLMAHGMGKPVTNASTKIKVKKKGEYFVWARTRNWVPGPWEAPGRFQIAVNGKTLENTLGLKPGAEIRFGGMSSGRIVQIAPDAEDQTMLRVEMAVRPDIYVNTASIATIKQLGLTSDRHLEISTGDLGAERHEPGAEIHGVTTSGEFIDIPDVTGVVARVEMLLDEENQHLAELSEFIGKPISLSVEPSANPEQYDIVLR